MKINVLCWTIILLTALTIVEGLVLREQAQIIYDQQMSSESAPCEATTGS